MSTPGLSSTPTDSVETLTLKLTNTRRWIIIELLFLASLINYFDRATISFALPLISKDLNLGPEAKGVLLSAFFWSYAFMQIPLGTCVDRFNLRWLYAGALTLWSVAQGLTGFAGSLALLMFFRFILGLGEAIYLVGGTKVVSLLFPLADRGLPCGLFDFGTRTGLVLEGLILPWMLNTFGWRPTFAFVGFAALLWLVPWLKIYPANLRRGYVSVLAGGNAILTLAANGALVGSLIGLLSFIGALNFLKVLLPYLGRSLGALILIAKDLLQSSSQSPLLAAAHTALNYALVGTLFGVLLGIAWVSWRGRSKPERSQAKLAVLKIPEPMPARENVWPHIRAALRNRDFLGVLLGFFCFDYYWYLLVTWLPDYLVNVRHLTILQAGWRASFPYLVFGLSQPLGGWIADRLIRAGYDSTLTRKGIISLAFLTGLLLIPAAQVSSSNAALALIMCGCLVGLSTANQLVILQNCAPPEQVGLWVGIYNTVGNIAGILAPIVTGFLIKVTGSYTPAFVVAAVMIAVGQLSYWFVVGKLKASDRT